MLTDNEIDSKDTLILKRNVGSCIRIQKDIAEMKVNSVLCLDKLKFCYTINELLTENNICILKLEFSPLYSHLSGKMFVVSILFSSVYCFQIAIPIRCPSSNAQKEKSTGMLITFH